MIRSVCVATALLLPAVSAQAQSVRSLHSFDAATEGSSMSSPLTQARDGLFYGVNPSNGPYGKGTLFRMTPNGTLLVLHAFTGGVDGGSPRGELVEGHDGRLYGMTGAGGAFNAGVAYRIAVDGDFAVLHDFGENADAPRSPATLLQTAGGDFYGASCTGGASGAGTLFRMTTAGDVTPLYAFTNGVDGRCPTSLLLARDGMFYGVAAGGTTGEGVAFRMSAGGALVKIHDYVRGVEGGAPNGLIQSRFDGQLYGTTSTIGGPFNFTYGTLYRMNTSGAVQVLHAFGNGTSSGIYPVGRLVEGTDGNFYGVTSHGGLPVSSFTSGGTVFRVARDGTHTVLKLFRGQFDGTNPETGLMQGSEGHLYGTVSGGFSDEAIYRVELYLCTDSIDATYTPEFQSLNLSLRVQSSGPGTWSLWVIGSGGAAPITIAPVAPVSVPAAVNFGYNVAPSGPLLFVTRLDVPGFGSCGGVSFVDTRSPDPRPPIPD